MPQRLFILSSICGLVTGLIVIVSTFVIKSGNMSCLLVFLTSFLLGGLWLWESCFLITLSVTRFVSVQWPFVNIEWQTIKRIIITSIILCPTIQIITSLITDDDTIYWIMTGVFIPVTLFIMLASSILTINGLLNRPRRILRANHNNARRDYYNRTWKPVIRIITIQIVYILCSLPITVYSVLFINNDDTGKVTTSTLEQSFRNQLWFMMVSEMYNGINACLYIAQCKEIRRFYYRLIVRKGTIYCSPATTEFKT